MHNIILCGGSGTRLWPISRALMPKQFIKIFDNQSLFQQTVERNKAVCQETIVVTNNEQYYLALDQASVFSGSLMFLLETEAKNTAPAILSACFGLADDDIVLVTPSDHLIQAVDSYYSAIEKAKTFAEQGFLVTFGIKPSEPKTGYGYIETENVYDVKMFHEKPQKEKAQEYLARGNFLWNAGMFCFQVKTLKEELQKYAPDLYKAVLKVYEYSQNTHKEPFVLSSPDLAAVPNISIDYALFEKSSKIKVVPCDFAWNDIGSFDSLSAVYSEEQQKQLASVVSYQAKNNFIYCADSPQKMVAAVDVENLIVIDTSDALLIVPKGSSEKVKQVVDIVKEQSEQYKTHKTVHRPWGTYTVLEIGTSYKIKKITVLPGKKLSLQKHFHRNEHWIVVSGTATVQKGNTEVMVCPNESIYIKMGEKHRLSNEGLIPVVLIEAQVGEYTGEDDIVRYDDEYGRE